VAAPSSTSSSRAAGPPWGLVTAAGLLLLLELVLRLLNPKGILANDAGEMDLAYRSVVTELEAGAAEVVVVGSSRARRGVLAPVLERAMKTARIKGNVENFSLGRARAEDVALVVKRVGEAKPRPKLLIWSLSARELEPSDARPDSSVRYLWRPSDWLEARSELGAAADAYLPDALRNEAARVSYLVRYRFAFQDALEQRGSRAQRRDASNVLVPVRKKRTPMQGGIASVYEGKQRNVSLRIDRERVKAYLGNAYRDPKWPQNYQSDYLEAAVRHARKLGVPVLLVEIPVHPMLEEAMPPGTPKKFRSHLHQVARRQGVPFVSAPELGVRFVPKDFYEQSHLNYRGAQKYSEAIAPFVLRAVQGTKQR